MDNDYGRLRKGIGRLHEDSLQSVVFAKHVTESFQKTPPRRQKRHVLTTVQSLARRDETNRQPLNRDQTESNTF